MNRLLTWLVDQRMQIAKLRHHAARLRHEVDVTRTEFVMTAAENSQLRRTLEGEHAKLTAANLALAKRNAELRRQVEEYERTYVHPTAADMNKGAA